MSLKAKLEAVIYAAEEPVTLAQMAQLFAEEALEWKAQLAAQRAEEMRASQLDLVEAPDPEPAWETKDFPIAEAETAPHAAVEASQQYSQLETPALAAPDPELEAKRLARLRDREVREVLRGLLDELLAEYASSPRGIEIREIAGGYRMATKPECHDAVRAFVKSLKPPLKLSLPALETLAVIAYKQPVTAPEVGEIRGVDSAGVLGSLISRKLITTAGRKQVVGRPMLYKTTKEFLLRFGLKDVAELPSMEEFERMATLELAETDDTDADAGEESGNLFAEVESSEEPQASDLVQNESTDAVTNEPEGYTPEPDTTETITPTAETSQEAAEAHAPVERLDAEEVEAQP